MATMPETRFADAEPRFARLLLIMTAASGILLASFALGASGPGEENGNDREGTDLDLYEAITERMREGESYYSAAHTELVDGGYGVQSVFNWRTPAHARLLAWAPSDAMAQLILAMIAVVTIVLTIVVLGRLAGRWGRLAGAVVVPLTLLTAFLPGTVLLAELAAGVLILLSVGLYAVRQRWGALVAAAVALFIRELAGLYVVVLLVLAVRSRRWKEVMAWCVVLAGYATYFLWHRNQVLATVDPGDRADASGWLQLGGPMFALRTAQMDGVLLLIPLAAIGLLTPFMVLGLWHWGDEAGLIAAVTACGYLVAFCLVGKDVNAYWGALYTPLFAYGLVLAPVAVLDLWRAAARLPSSSSAGESVPGTSGRCR